MRVIIKVTHDNPWEYLFVHLAARFVTFVTREGSQHMCVCVYVGVMLLLLLHVCYFLIQLLDAVYMQALLLSLSKVYKCVLKH
jgi:hypothetical protein